MPGKPLLKGRALSPCSYALKTTKKLLPKGFDLLTFKLFLDTQSICLGFTTLNSTEQVKKANSVDTTCIKKSLEKSDPNLI